jgi:hypothetical protein
MKCFFLGEIFWPKTFPIFYASGDSLAKIFQKVRERPILQNFFFLRH